MFSMAQANYTFNFDPLVTGRLGLTAIGGAYFAEAASYCLHVNQHSNPVRLCLSGDVDAVATLTWTSVGESHGRTHADLQDAAEYGACAIAIVAAVHITGMSGVERSVKGTGIDFWLIRDSDERGLFQRSARLEASGILKQNNQNTVAARVKQKLAQTKRTDKSCLPAYVVVVEFGQPEAPFLAKSTI